MAENKRAGVESSSSISGMFQSLKSIFLAKIKTPQKWGFLLSGFYFISPSFELEAASMKKITSTPTGKNWVQFINESPHHRQLQQLP